MADARVWPVAFLFLNRHLQTLPIQRLMNGNIETCVLLHDVNEERSAGLSQPVPADASPSHCTAVPPACSRAEKNTCRRLCFGRFFSNLVSWDGLLLHCCQH